MKPRIVILSAFATPFRSGAEACAEELAARLHLSGRFDVTIVTARMRKDLPERGHLPSGVPIVRVGCGYWFDKWLYPFLAPFAARKLRPQVVHAILETFAGLALCFCRFLVPGAKRVLTLQTTNRSFLKGFIIRSADAVTAISSVLVAQAKRLGRRDVMLIPNGVNFREIQEATSHHVKIPGRILFVGRLEKMKGIDLLLKAFAHLIHDPPETRFTRDTSIANLRIVGDGSERRSLEALSRRLNISDRVTFAGYIPQPAVYGEYASAEIFCGFSHSEAFGNVFLEAQAAGCAVIAGAVGGIKDIVKDGKTGKLVDPNETATADGLKHVYNDERLRSSFVRIGSMNDAYYDWDAIAEKYAAMY